MSTYTSRHGFLVHEQWLTGVPAEDDVVERGKCPYRTGVDPPALCGADRSPVEVDWPHCRLHGPRVRDDLGRGWFAG